MTTPTPEPEDSSSAAQTHLINIANSSALSILISIGHRLGLFDVLPLTPQDGLTSTDIAQKAGLNERYVREWLGGLVCGKIVSFDPSNGRYHLEPDYAPFLTQSSPENMAPFISFLPMMGAVQDKIVKCFRKGGGVPYEEFPRFHEVMEQMTEKTLLPVLFSDVLPLDPAIPALLERGNTSFIDIGCGHAHALLALAERYPTSQFTGLDLSASAIASATAAATEKGLSNVRFVVADVDAALPEGLVGSFDIATTFDAVHDQARPDIGLKAVYELLKPGGIYLMQDINASSHLHNNIPHPTGPFLYTISLCHCMTVSLAQPGGMGLGTVWGVEKATEMVQEAGFRDVKVNHLEVEPMNFYLICRK
ncbi:hypothetical protein HK104_011030 [Borealophlyctis nickersoniae]|nr:hypothetical protein HK104_011030 [Borealophlyctis nickersoniae]